MRTGGTQRIVARALTRSVAVAIAATLLLGTPSVASVPSTTATATPQTFAASFFGMSAGADLTQLPDAAFNKELDLMQQAGVHWLRAAIPWGRVHHVKDYPDKWNLIDRLVQGASTRNMQVLGIVDNPPDWAKVNVPRVSCTVQPPFDLTEYAKFVGRLAARYSASVLSAIELENSPNLSGIWSHPDPCAYAALMKLAYPAVKNANPAIKVLNGGVGGTKTDSTQIAGDVFFADLYKYGAKGNFDIASFHPYSYPCFASKPCSKDRSWYHIPSVRATMVNHGDGAKPIWATEFGAPTNGGSARDGHVSEQTQAALIVDGMKAWHQYSFAGPLFVFQFRDNGTDPRVKNDWFGLVTNDLSRLKPSYTAYKSLATA